MNCVHIWMNCPIVLENPIRSVYYPDLGLSLFSFDLNIIPLGWNMSVSTLIKPFDYRQMDEPSLCKVSDCYFLV